MTFADVYGAAFTDYLRGSGESALETAYELGRRAVQERMSMLELAEIHHAAVTQALEAPVSRDGLMKLAEAGASFLSESLSAYEMVQRGFREVQEEALLEQQYADQLRALADGSTALNSTFSVEEILRLMVELAPRIIGARRCMVGVSGDDSGQRTIAFHPDWKPAISAELLAGFDGRSGRFQAPNGEELLVGTVRGVDGGRATIVLSEKEGGSFTERDEAVLAKLSQTCSVAIERAGLYERQRRIAETLQRALLPKSLPEIPGLSLASRYLPGGAGENVGGDWYDVLMLPNDRVGLVLGDVVGRGVRAASEMGQARMAFRAYAMEHEEPSVVADRMSRLLLEVDSQSFSTMVYLTLEPSSGKARMVRAGHLPPLLIEAGGDVHFLEEALSPPLCGLPDPVYVDSKVALASGDTLVLYTDGLIGRRELDTGMARMRSIAADAAGDPESLCDRILERMPLDSEDDVALLVVRLD